GTVVVEQCGFAGVCKTSYATATCAAKGRKKAGFTCPPAKECVDEESFNLKPYSLKSIESRKKPIIIDESGGWKVPSASVTPQ
ncbi:MAG: hypothetical protein HON90_10800, partial [Halobacteriovoraceae bacterium]|nr:hypothetical protein [Halobacteriovoraceae bacterium]